MKRTKKASLILGIIISAIGLIGVIMVASARSSGFEYYILPIIVLVIGIILILLYVYKRSTVNTSNKYFLRKYFGKELVTTCFYCGHQISAHAEDFSVHRRYPEGFIYCPVCHKPLSINAFNTIDEQPIYPWRH
ncbi:MAG: hypothetical protein Q4D15_08330 [Lachnospiraceae bacterium]|nr:hypothetical protein [Lachnospiraceae bacterium]